ncbi:hypothetical protein [Butyrivibrio sp. MB2005]|uniref:hypothetical protein n=1 Tax=Butyrivibrio sp. MB2005 TaxID=1280678 RepID=UPI0003F51D11|nr:hypothetical protein [Butyrivibrio sp. MB2005]
MNYYAAVVREHGAYAENSDGLMIKGRRVGEENVVMMALCTPFSKNRRGAKLSDHVIRTLEEIFEEVEPSDLYDSCKELFFDKRLSSKNKLSIMFFRGADYFILSNCGRQIAKIGVRNKKIIDRPGDGYFHKEAFGLKGRLTEGCTILISTDSYSERLSDREIIGNLSPQMCVDSEYMEYALGFMSRSLIGKGEERPRSAAALCIR